jgi:hypothetical protein
LLQNIITPQENKHKCIGNLQAKSLCLFIVLISTLYFIVIDRGWEVTDFFDIVFMGNAKEWKYHENNIQESP